MSTSSLLSQASVGAVKQQIQQQPSSPGAVVTASPNGNAGSTTSVAAGTNRGGGGAAAAGGVLWSAEDSVRPSSLLGSSPLFSSPPTAASATIKASPSASSIIAHNVENAPMPDLRDFLHSWLARVAPPNVNRNAANLLCNTLQIETLEELCGQTSENAANAAQVDPVLMYCAISDAHREIKRVGAPIDWITRLGDLYSVYDPSKVRQLSMLLQAYSGEEESLWRSAREKYEHDVAVAAAVFDVTQQQQSTTNAALQQAQQQQRGAAGTTATEAELQEKIAKLEQSMVMMQQAYANSQDDLRSLAHEYNEAVARLTDRAEKAEAEVTKLRLVNVEQLEWIKVLEQRLSSRSGTMMSGGVGGGSIAGGGGGGASQTGSVPRSGSVQSALMMQGQIPATSPSARASLRARLTDFYFKYDPSRIPEVDSVLEQWAGREIELEQLLETAPTRTES